MSEQEWEAWDRMQFATTEAAVFRNVTIILMTAVGWTKASTASDVGCSLAMVENVRHRYRQHGRDGVAYNRYTC